MWLKAVRTLLATTLIVLGLFFGAPTARADNANGSVNVTYTFDATGKSIHVRVEGNFTYYAPSTTENIWSTCWAYGGYYVGWYSYGCYKPQVTNYYIYPYHSIERGATNIQATVDGASSRVVAGSNYSAADVALKSLQLRRKKVFSGDSVRWTIDYDLAGSSFRSNDAIRVSDAYTYLCAWGGVLNSGSVKFVVPATKAGTVVTVPEMAKSESGNSVVYSSGLISDPKSQPYCFEKVDEASFQLDTFSTSSQSKITILSYPDDAFWRAQANQKALPLAEALEDITGLPLGLSGDVRVREAAPVSELRNTRLGDYSDGLARVSENFNSETFAHELAHHWFGKGIADNWVFEGLAEYLGQRAIESTGEALEEKACSKGWYLPQKDAKQPLSLSSWEFVSSNAESSAVDGKIERINGLYKNACAVFTAAVMNLDSNDRASVFGSFARGSTTFNPADDQPLTASEAIDLLILADNLDGTNFGLQWTIDGKLGLLAPNDEAGLAARELGLAKYAPTFRWLASVGWSAPTFVASPLASQDYATSTQAIDALDQAAIVKGYSSWSALVQEAVTASQSTTVTPEDLVRIGNSAAAATDVVTTIQAYLDIVSVAKNLANLQANPEGSPDPVSVLGRLVVGNVAELQAQSLQAFGEGDLKAAQQLSQSAIFARDMAWAVGFSILLLLLALVVLLSYRTPRGRKRIDLLVARLLNKRKQKRSAA
jgi:hypothetical protein